MIYPDRIADEPGLDELLSRPSTALSRTLDQIRGDIVVLGAGGKMGVSLAMMARRSRAESGAGGKVFAVSRFTDEMARKSLDDAGVETIRCDLLDMEEVSRLPAAPNVLFLAGRKFGTEADRELTWSTNVLVPGIVAGHYRNSRIVVFSTGNVYPPVRPEEGGCTENTEPAPVGEYAQSCLGRERVFSYFSRTFGTRICLLRLNYAIDLRYGILHDIARGVYGSERVDISVSHFNCIWQGDANRMALQCLDLCSSPPVVLNLTGTEMVSTRSTVEQFAGYFNMPVRIAPERPVERMYLSDASRAAGILGGGMVPVSTMIRWQAEWIRAGGRSLERPTHFGVTDGQF